MHLIHDSNQFLDFLAELKKKPKQYLRWKCSIHSGVFSLKLRWSKFGPLFLWRWLNHRPFFALWSCCFSPDPTWVFKRGSLGIDWEAIQCNSFLPPGIRYHLANSESGYFGYSRGGISWFVPQHASQRETILQYNSNQSTFSGQPPLSCEKKTHEATANMNLNAFSTKTVWSWSENRWPHSIGHSWLFHISPIFSLSKIYETCTYITYVHDFPMIFLLFPHENTAATRSGAAVPWHSWPLPGWSCSAQSDGQRRDLFRRRFSKPMYRWCMIRIFLYNCSV